MAFYLKLFNKHSEYETYINDSDKILPNISYCEDNDEVHFNPWTDPRVIAKFNIEDETEPVMLYGIDDVIGTELFSKIEIDGEEISISDLDNDGRYYTFDTTGEHTVKYTLLDPTSIGDYAFSGCDSLTSITIPNSVTSIGDDAFSGRKSLTSIRVESGNTVYDSRGNCNAIIETATNTLISGCKNTIIPSSVTSIGDWAFSYCSGLTSITIPNSVTSIGGTAFRNCTSLESITSLATTAPTIQSNTFRYVKTGGTLYVPSGSTGYDVWMGTGDFYLGKYNWTKLEQ